MPPRWPRQPDRADPAFRRLDDRMTFATHVAAFAAVNSGLWFFRVAGEKLSTAAVPGGLPGTPAITLVWAIALVAHSKSPSSLLSPTARASGDGGGADERHRPRAAGRRLRA